MRVQLGKHECVITREAGDKPIYEESALHYAIKQTLRAQGEDVIKKLMHKDGHLTGDDRYYIRDRKWKYAILWNDYYIVSPCRDYNGGRVTFRVIRFDEEHDSAI